VLSNKNIKWFIIQVSLDCSEDKIKRVEDEFIQEGIDIKICV
jgi:hypothetical protein